MNDYLLQIKRRKFIPNIYSTTWFGSHSMFFYFFHNLIRSMKDKVVFKEAMNQIAKGINSKRHWRTCSYGTLAEPRAALKPGHVPTEAYPPWATPHALEARSSHPAAPWPARLPSVGPTPAVQMPRVSPVPAAHPPQLPVMHPIFWSHPHPAGSAADRLGLGWGQRTSATKIEIRHIGAVLSRLIFFLFLFQKYNLNNRFQKWIWRYLRFEKTNLILQNEKSDSFSALDFKREPVLQLPQEDFAWSLYVIDFLCAGVSRLWDLFLGKLPSWHFNKAWH
jgi:hypothetical protein